MKNKILLSLGILVISGLLWSCKSQTSENKTVAPKKDSVAIHEPTEGHLFGEISESDFQQEPYKEWYDAYYNLNPVSDDEINQLKPLLKDVTLITFMGTWCGDSQREVPAMLNILDRADPKNFTHEMHAVNDMKDSKYGETEAMGVVYVPTFIFMKNGKEIGRIVEAPAGSSLQQDMIDILSGKPYSPLYSE